MAKNTITNAQFVTTALNFIKANPDAFAEFVSANSEAPVADVIAKGEAYQAVLTKPRSKSKAPSKKHLASVAELNRIADQLNEPMTCTAIASAFGLTSPQKANGLMRIGVTMGIIERITDGKTVLFRKVA